MVVPRKLFAEMLFGIGQTEGAGIPCAKLFQLFIDVSSLFEQVSGKTPNVYNKLVNNDADA